MQALLFMDLAQFLKNLVGCGEVTGVVIISLRDVAEDERPEGAIIGIPNVVSLGV
jgi:hypothetical protein